MRIFLALTALIALAACGDPLRDVERLSDVVVAEDVVSVAPTPEETADAPGFFQRIFEREADDPVTDAIELALEEATANDIEDIVPVALETEPPQSGLRGLLGRLRGADTTAPVVETIESDIVADAPILESRETVLTPEDIPEPTRAGLFGLFRSNDTPPRAGAAPDITDQVPFGIVLPFGEVAPICDLSRAQMGTQIGSESGFKLWDSAPGSLTPRTHYITGFGDRCARQFTAALVLFGDVGTHELVRYRVNNRLAYSATDEAYEVVKAGFCRVERGEECGAKLDRLSNGTVFLSGYERFGTSPVWLNILLSDRALKAYTLVEG